MADEKTIYRMTTPDGNPVRVEEAWKDASGEALTEKVNKADAQTITGAKTFSSPIKTEEIDNTSGNAMLRNKSTEDAIVLGSSAKKAVIMGSGDRPTYSKDGSDFTGSELALKSDVTDLQSAKWNKLMANLGIGRWSNQTFYNLWDADLAFVDAYMDSYTSYIRMFGNADASSYSTITIPDMNSGAYRGDFCFASFKCPKLVLSNGNIAGDGIFKGATCTKITVKDGCTFTIGGLSKGLYDNCVGAFTGCSNLVTIGPLKVDVHNSYSMYQWFVGCTKLKSIQMTNWSFSFDIHYSTAFEREDLLVILNNLTVVSSTQTLTMGATNLAKLTSDDILIATGKGWALA